MYIYRILTVLAITITATIAIGQTSSPPATVKIGKLTWTKENLNIETPDSRCYEYKASNCAKYGRLYTMRDARNVCVSLGGKWRLPSSEDWDDLLRTAGGTRQVDKLSGEVSYTGNKVGRRLKSKSGWRDGHSFSGQTYDSNGTDDYGFTGLPGGAYDHSKDQFLQLGSYGGFWSTREGDDGYRSYAYAWGLGSNDEGTGDVGEGGAEWGGGYAISVRCVRPD